MEATASENGEHLVELEIDNVDCPLRSHCPLCLRHEKNAFLKSQDHWCDWLYYTIPKNDCYTHKYLLKGSSYNSKTLHCSCFLCHLFPLYQMLTTLTRYCLHCGTRKKPLYWNSHSSLKLQNPKCIDFSWTGGNGYRLMLLGFLEMDSYNSRLLRIGKKDI